VPKPKPPSSIRAAVVERAAALDLTAGAIARQTEGVVSDDMLRLYLTGKSDLTSAKLDAVFRVLGMAPALADGA
jgi:hypothetical protein